MKKLLFVIGAALVCSLASADRYFFGIGINDYQTPKDQYGRPAKDKKGKVVDLDLRGCLSDLTFYKSFFGSRGGVPAANMTILRDGQATSTNVVQKLGELIAKLKPGDTLYFSYAGHGTQLEDPSKPTNASEFIVLQDLVLIADSDFKAMTDSLNAVGIKVTYVFDSCHAQGMSQDTPKVKKLARRFVSRDIAKKFKKRSTNGGKSFTRKMTARRQSAAESLFVFACGADQSSADITLMDNTSHGAFSYYLEKAVQSNPNAPIEDLIKGLRESLEDAGFSQKPDLEGSTERKRRPLPG